jgi:hypothetical protein
MRDLMLMLRESLEERDIPHRTKIRSAIIDRWLEYYLQLLDNLQVTLSF